MPKRGNDRQSSRDDARGPGAPGGDEDYAWIKYLGEGRAPGSGGGAAQSNGGRSQPSMSDAQMSGTRPPVRTVYAPPAEPAYPQPPSDPYYGRQALPASPSPSRALARRPGGDRRSGG